MFNTAVLDVGIGLVFTFLAVSLVSSAVTEALASMLKWRSATLLTGIKNLLNDHAFEGLARSVYNHALINPRADGKAATESEIKSPPTYVDPKQFADALIDVTKIAADAPAGMKAAIDQNVRDPQLNQLLKGIVDRSEGKLDNLQRDLATWFDSAMDRVGGAYKRKTQLCSFIVALTLAVLLNVDSIHVGKALWEQPMLAKAIEVKSGDTPEQTLARLEALGLPIGWTSETSRRLGQNPMEVVVGLLGWLITALATLFGAPFWFDSLQRFARLKGSGPSPSEKKAGTGASA
jgi:hypothetical protein